MPFGMDAPGTLIQLAESEINGTTGISPLSRRIKARLGRAPWCGSSLTQFDSIRNTDAVAIHHLPTLPTGGQQYADDDERQD
jgi:hypothetical protein